MTETGVFAQRFDQTGRRLGSELAINTFTTNRQETPAVAMDGRGGFVIAWESYAQDSASQGAFARRGGFPPAEPMEVDQRASGGTSDVNGVLESGERVAVDPAYGNPSAPSLPLSGTASNLTGPLGPTYTLHDAAADYGSIAAAATSNCLDASANCYEVTVGGARPAQHWDATFDESLSLPGLTKRWSLHVGDSFADVPQNAFYPFIENLPQRGHRRLRRRRILPGQQRHPRPDGGLPPEVALRIELRPPRGDGHRVPRRPRLEPRSLAGSRTSRPSESPGAAAAASTVRATP